MTLKAKTTWIVVADSGLAQFYSLHGSAAAPSIEPAAEAMVSGIHRHASDLKSDKPGRAFAGARSTTRAALEPHHDYHKGEKHEFMRAVAAALGRAFAARKFERLIVVAPERSIGELRAMFSPDVKAAVWREIAKDFAKLERRDLQARLARTLMETLP